MQDSSLDTRAFYRSLYTLKYNRNCSDKVIWLNLNIKITAQNYRRTRTKHRKDKKGRGWTKLERIEVYCI